MYAAQLVLVGVLYVLAARVAARVDTVQEDYRVLWPQAGVALWGMLLFGLRCWPAVAGGSLFLTLRSNYEFGVAVMFAAGNTLGPLVAALLMKHVGRFNPRMGRVSDIHALILFGGFLGPVISASLATTAIAIHLPIEPLMAWNFGWRRCLGLGISNVVVTPLLLSWSHLPSLRWPLIRLGEVGLLLALLISLGFAGFTTRKTFGVWDYPISYAPFPFLIWAALRFGIRGAATSVFLVAAAAIVGTSRGFGLFARTDPNDRLVILQIYLLMLSFTGLYLAAAVAERRTMMERLSETTDKLRALSARIERAREEERARISREIHDELGQQLTGLKMSLHTLIRRLPPAEEALVSKAQALSGMIDESVATVRRIATDLRPGILDDLGITASLQWQAEEFEKRTGIPTRFSSGSEDVSLEPALSTALFRILQEALTNVARHANATSVTIRFQVSDAAVTLTVTDNGIGMPDELRGGGLGLVGMRERAELLGGTLVVRAGRPGTEVEACIPVRRETNR
ncbi:MAG: MASE1 domain-containing protein [Candidatus Sumerlaeaceae bacterium]|nr:MASE1 domain-containing protein [Candidatus Sumerlaeaceae bacterium]